jgi:aminopeptidase N
MISLPSGDHSEAGLGHLATLDLASGSFQAIETGFTAFGSLRADGDSVDQAAFGGPIIYGHGVEQPKNNLFHYQTTQANEVFRALDSQQAAKALIKTAPKEDAVVLQGDAGAFPGISVGELSADQKQLVEKTLKVLLAPYRQEDVDEVFEITGQCLDECARIFGVPYPFGKFDQVFVPEFSILSLDHPACVLIRELYLFRSAAADSERETRAVVIAHGISLMWMAGLVTNAWWDDLWLGQAFADYMAHRVTSEVTRFPGPLTTFSVRRKGQAYVADQRPSTHPVCVEGPDVQSILLDMDRISYFKGSSTIRQLATTVGTDVLRTGLQTYFARHAYGTATFADFLAALSEASGHDMSGWAAKWFRESNVNTLTPEFTVDDGVIASAAIIQSAPDSHPVMRPHSLDIGLYGDDADDHTTARVTIDGPRTELPALVGRPAPAFLLINEDDLTYAKIRLDPRSRAALPDLLPRLSPMNRGMVWCSLLQAVMDGAFPPLAHLDLVTQMIAVETELSIIAEVLEQARGDVADRFLEPAQRAAAMARVARSLRQRLAVTRPGDERQISLYRSLIEFTDDVAELRDWLSGARDPAPGLRLDADLRWRVWYRLAVLGDATEEDIDAAYDADQSAHGEQSAAKCRASRPDAAVKAATWESIINDTSLSSYGLWALAEGFWQPEQTALTAPFEERFFDDIRAVADMRGDVVLDVLIRFLYPRFAATGRTLDRAAALLARDDITVSLRRRITDSTDDLRRVVEARAHLDASDRRTA